MPSPKLDLGGVCLAPQNGLGCVFLVLHDHPSPRTGTPQKVSEFSSNLMLPDPPPPPKNPGREGQSSGPPPPPPPPPPRKNPGREGQSSDPPPPSPFPPNENCGTKVFLTSAKKSGCPESKHKLCNQLFVRVVQIIPSFSKPTPVNTKLGFTQGGSKKTHCT